MKISYLVTCSTETETLEKLLKRLSTFIQGKEDEIVVLTDGEVKPPTLDIVMKYRGEKISMQFHSHPLNADYGVHKNFGNSKCTGDYIFQLDGDELPSEYTLGDNLREIIGLNPEVELIFVPRINDYRGVKEDHARQWGWRLTPSPGCENRPIVNWPDYQGRIYKNIQDRIKWDRKLHEKITGHEKYSLLPPEEDYAIYHDKTIEKQLETNIRYNKVFTVEDNMGHKVI